MAKRIRFSNPPVIEVVCGVQFGNLERLFAPHHGIFWKSIRKEFPVVQEAPPLDPIVESYEEGPSRLTIGVSDRPPLPRVWLLSDNEQSLIQLQRDRFYYNWKRSDNKVPYPSYDRVIVEFERHLLAFQEFVAAEKLGEIEFRQCELTYVNHIDKNMGLPEGEGGGGLLVDHVNDTTRKRFVPQAEQYHWRTVYRLPDDAGRLYVTAQSAQRTSDGARIMRLDLTTRGIGSDRSRDGLRQWFDLAHEWIVNGFADITDPDTQETVWNRIL